MVATPLFENLIVFSIRLRRDPGCNRW